MSGNVSDCSDDSFEIISPESTEEPETVINSSYKPSVKFLEIFDVYPVDTDIVARISFIDGYEKSPEDQVVIIPMTWGSLNQAVCVSKLQGNFVKFDVKDLPKTSGDKYYQFCYSSKDRTVVGVSAPFSFREVHEDELMEFQKEQNKEFWTFRSRFAILMNTYWNSLVESKRTIDHEENEVVLIDAGNDPFKNEATEIIEISDETPCVPSQHSTPICEVEPTESNECKTKIESEKSDLQTAKLELYETLIESLNSSAQTNPFKQQSGKISCDSLETDTPLDLSSLMANVKLDRNADRDNLSKSDDMKGELEQIESERKMRYDYQKKCEKEKKEIDDERLSVRMERERMEIAEQKFFSELNSLKDENELLKHELKKIKSSGNGNAAASQQIRDLMCANNALQSELNQLKLREVSLLRQLKDYEDVKNSYQGLEIELKNTQELLEYMIEQKDERLKKMTSEERKGHLYVYDFMKSQFKKRNGDADEVEAKVEQEPSTSGLNPSVVESRSPSTAQDSNSKPETVPECEESHLIDQGYENEEHRQEHIHLLKKLKAWFEDESLDGAEEIRNELRKQYIHMERMNRHLSSEVLRLKDRCAELETLYDRSRSELTRTEDSLTRKVNEKVSLSKLLEATREKMNHLTSEKRACEKNDSIVEGLKHEIAVSRSKLEKIEVELKKEKESNETLKRLMEKNEEDYASELVNMNFQNQKLSEQLKAMKSDYEMRLKLGAKEYAKLSVKYHKVKDLCHGLSRNQAPSSGSPY